MTEGEDTRTYDVVEIGDNAFTAGSMVSITIPPNVTKIGEKAFYHCLNLESITHTDGVYAHSESKAGAT